jgi:uncharacterized protein (TIGR03435 family)
MNAITLIAAAVLNSLWQAAVLAFLVWLAVELARPGVNAATRHIVWWIALAAVVVLPCVPQSAPSARIVPPPEPPVAATTLPVRVSAPLAPPLAPSPVTVTEKRAAVWPFLVLAVWAAVFARGTIRIVRSYLYLRGVKRRAVAWEVPLPGAARSARLLVSPEIPSPIAAGFLHPAVIVPAALRERLTAAEMNCVLLHEYAHLARYDDWVNLMARLLGAVIALHPVAWWILRRIEHEREMACDDWVVAQTGAARTYAESLARILELRVAPADSVLAAGIFTRRSRLRERIEMLLRRGREFSPATSRVSVGAATLALAALAAGGALAPHWIAFAQRPEFEVASVKVNTTNGPMDAVPRRSGDLIMMHNTQPYSMVYYAYRLNGAYQMVGYARLPDGWNWFDIDARAGRDATDDQVRLMFQSLLEDRFKLKVHRETRDIPEYELAVAKGKPKLTPSRSDEPMAVTIEEKRFTQSAGTCGISSWREGLHLICHAAPIEKIVAALSGSLQAPVVDRTGLTGTYDLNVLFIPEDRRLNADTESGPSLDAALQAELGLKLEKGKGPVEVLVIDHMEKPSPN